MTNKEILEKAIQKAIDGGWDTYITTDYKLNDDMLINESYAPEVNFTHVNSVIFNHDFAKALWGENPYYNGQPILSLVIGLKQFAIEHLGKIYNVDSNQKFYKVMEYKRTGDGLESTFDMKEVTYQLKKLGASIPLRTHKIEHLDVVGTIPEWQYHLQNMVIADDPIKYLGEHLND